MHIMMSEKLSFMWTRAESNTGADVGDQPCRTCELPITWPAAFNACACR
jgi:hypothetical protein